MMDSVGDYTSQLAQALARDPTNKVAVLTSAEAGPATTRQDIDVLPYISSCKLSEAPSILREVRRWKPDLVHLQFPSGPECDRVLPILLLLYLRWTGTPVIQTWHFIGNTFQAFRTLPFGFLSFWSVPCAVFVVDESYLEWSKSWTRFFIRHKTLRFVPNGSAIPSVELGEAERLDYRMRYAAPQKKIIAYFGFLYPGKGVEQLFEIADATDSHIVIVGGLFTEENLRVLRKEKRQKFLTYAQNINRLANSDKWSGKVTLTGFLPPHDVACVLKAADAVVLPYSDGCKPYNTCLYAAQAQGTFVLTTSHDRSGYHPDENTYYARPNDIASMKAALVQYHGRQLKRELLPDGGWGVVRDLHVDLYRTQLVARTSG